MFLLFLLFISVESHLNDQSSLSERHFIYNNTYQYDTDYRLELNISTQQIMDFIEKDDSWSKYPSQVSVWCEGATHEQPLFIIATQQEDLVSWKLPTPGGEYGLQRTLCPSDLTEPIPRPSLQLWSAAVSSFTLTVRRQRDFYLSLSSPLLVHASPPAPTFHYFSFSSVPTRSPQIPHFNYTAPKSVIVIVDSTDDVCATVSVQNYSCPVALEQRGGGLHFTMTRRGGITLTQSMYPMGFYLVVAVHNSQEPCGVPGDTPHRNKSLSISVVSTISYTEYVEAGAMTVAALLVAYVLVLMLAYLPCGGRNESEESSSSLLVAETLEERVESEEPLRADEGQHAVIEHRGQEETGHTPEPAYPVMSLLPRAAPSPFAWSLCTVFLAHALPAVQLLASSQASAAASGHVDRCYYNFLCAHPLPPLADFNHVFSNVGYVVFGGLFILQVRWRKRRFEKLTPELQNLGVPPNFGLLQAVGASVAGEGLMSASYHLCPNRDNFQFDISMMHVTSLLLMLCIFTARHGAASARPHVAFTLVAVVFALDAAGTAWPALWLWVVFSALHAGGSLLLTLHIYYLRPVTLDVLTRAGLRNLFLQPRGLLLCLATALNWGYAVYGLYEHNRDFARHLLAILTGNALLYILFYVVMKLIHREKVSIRAAICGIGAAVLGVLAARAFLAPRARWAASPAESRSHNRACDVFGFYDTHDVWHLTSAAAMLLALQFLLAVDEPLRYTPRNVIPVF